MLEPVNNALAGLELRALREAVVAGGQADSARSKEAAVLALAVHGYRWDRLDNVARAIERSKEVVEGTAKYVETQAVAAFTERCRAGASPRLRGLCRLFADMDTARWLTGDFDRLFKQGAIAPTDMPRNRIYPMAATVALLLDIYQPRWKTMIESEGTTRGLFVHLTEALAGPATSQSELVERARERYGWQELLAASETLVKDYLTGFAQALAVFETEAGTRVVIRVPATGVTRSRLSREQRWVVDAGRRTLGRFVVYTLRRRKEPALELRIENASVLDETDDGGNRVVTFHIAGPIVITADGQRLAGETKGSREFQMLSFQADGAALQTDLSGMLAVRPGELHIDVKQIAGR